MFFTVNLICAVFLFTLCIVAIGALIGLWIACGVEKFRVGYLGCVPLRYYSFRGLWARFLGVKS